MNELFSAFNTFVGAGASSALVGYLAGHIDPIIAAIIWTYPFTIIIPLYMLHKNNKTNKFISNYVRVQAYALILLLIFIYAMSYFIGKTATKDGVIEPILKATGVWLISSLLFYGIVKSTHLDKNF